MPSPDILTAAAQWHTTGATPLPAATDGTKRPGVHTWKQLQHDRPSLDGTLALFQRTDSDGIGIICGAASGHLEMLELEGVAVTEGVLTQLAQAMTDHDLTDLWQTIAGGYSELTPSGGIHYYYRVIDGPALGNTKLARRPATDAELAAAPGNRIRVLIETRGEGGWSIVAPSTGRTHPSGQAWRVIVGTPLTVPNITVEQRDTIHDICRLLDAMPEPVATAPTPAPSSPTTPTAPATGGLRPGDDYNQRARWEDILTPHGWTIDHRAGGTTYWIRPGKHRGEGVSATTGHSDDGQDRLFVFTTSTQFESEVPHTKFFAYAQLEHAGDLQAATRALAGLGFGDQTPPDTRLTLLPPPPTPAAATVDDEQPITDGALALATITHLQVTVIEDNEDALAQAFVAEVASTVRYVPQRKRWLTWNGARWEWDEVEAHREHIKHVARRLPRDSKTAAAFRRKMLSSSGISGVANMARTDPRIVVHVDDLDAHPLELNTPAGIANLTTGQITPPDPARLHTRTTAVAPDFDMPAPRWTKFLDDTFGGDQAMISYVQRLLGVAAIGEVREQILPLGIGVGANGKSVFVEACTNVLGRGERGYAIAANAEMLMVRKFQEHATELAQLAGARLVVCSELEDGARFAEARVKLLTGSDSISARFMARDFFTFTPSHTFLLVANHKPMATVGGLGFWRRVRLLPFHHVVPEQDRDPHLPDKLRAEWPAILAWIIRGAADYNQGGMRTPAGITAATEDYARDEDSMERFIADSCHLSPGSDLVRIRTSKLRAAYEQACREVGDEPVTARRFTQELRDRFGVGTAKSNGARFFTGITLLQVDDDTVDDDPETSLL